MNLKTINKMKEFKNENELLNEVARLDCKDLYSNVGFLNKSEEKDVFKIISETSKRLIYWNSFKKRFQIDTIGFYTKSY